MTVVLNQILAYFQTDEAWNYYAGAAEMAALAQFMQVRCPGVNLTDILWVFFSCKDFS